MAKQYYTAVCECDRSDNFIIFLAERRVLFKDPEKIFSNKWYERWFRRCVSFKQDEKAKKIEIIGVDGEKVHYRLPLAVVIVKDSQHGYEKNDTDLVGVIDERGLYYHTAKLVGTSTGLMLGTYDDGVNIGFDSSYICRQIRYQIRHMRKTKDKARIMELTKFMKSIIREEKQCKKTLNEIAERDERWENGNHK